MSNRRPMSNKTWTAVAQRDGHVLPTMQPSQAGPTAMTTQLLTVIALSLLITWLAAR